MKKIIIIILVVITSMWSIPIHATNLPVEFGYSVVCQETVIQAECVRLLPAMGVELYQLSFDYAQGAIEEKDFTRMIGNIIRKKCDSLNVNPALLVKVTPVKKWLSQVMKLGAREGKRQLAFQDDVMKHSDYDVN